MESTSLLYLWECRAILVNLFIILFQWFPKKLKRVANPLHDVAGDHTFWWPVVIFLSIDTFSNALLLSERIDGDHPPPTPPYPRKIPRKTICFQTICPRIEFVTPACEYHGAKFTFSQSHGAAWFFPKLILLHYLLGQGEVAHLSDVIIVITRGGFRHGTAWFRQN